MSKAQFEIIKKQSPQGMEEKPHIISQGMVHTESDQLTDISDQVVGNIYYSMYNLECRYIPLKCTLYCLKLWTVSYTYILDLV